MTGQRWDDQIKRIDNAFSALSHGDKKDPFEQKMMFYAAMSEMADVVCKNFCSNMNVTSFLEKVKRELCAINSKMREAVSIEDYIKRLELSIMDDNELSPEERIKILKAIKKTDKWYKTY